MRTCLFYIITVLFPLPCLGQEYNYVNYNTKDGLAGSTIYRMCQDYDGYMWFATDNGVSMYDGKKFRNFTTQDGLTDNDALYIEKDTKGRVWIMPFTKSVCYYYKGKIYNSQNDSTLKNLVFDSNVVGTPDTKGGMFFLSPGNVYHYTSEGEFLTLGNFKKLGQQFSLPATNFGMTQPKKFNDTLFLLNHNIVLISTGGEFTFFRTLKTPMNVWSKIQNYRFDRKNMEPVFPDPIIPYDFTTNYQLNDSTWLYNTFYGSYLIDREGHYDPKPFLQGKRVSCGLMDNEGNMWFGTLGEGVFKLTSKSMKTFFGDDEAFSLSKTQDRIYAGLANASMKVFHNFTLEKNYKFDALQMGSLSRRLYTLHGDQSGNMFLGFDLNIARFNKDRIMASRPIRAIKSIDFVDSDYVVFCTNVATLKARRTDLVTTDTLLKERGTKVLYSGGYYYIGTLNGLVIIDSAKTKVKKVEDPLLLNKRIIDMCKSNDGSIWVATNDNGVALYKNNRVDTLITEKNDLSSNICKSLFVKGNYLWVGTNKGLNKIDINTKKVLVKYSTADGFASDVINAVYVEDSTVWIATPAGVTFFNENDISDYSICQLNMSAITVSGQQLDSTDNFKLSYKKNNISFDYTAVSFKSAGEILYRYQLIGLDDDWKETELNTLSYPSLPPGDYTFRIYAINKFGKQSKTISIPFSITAPFWKTVWFWVAISLIMIGITWFLINMRYKRLQSRMKEKNELMRRMGELEQASLRAQMNPHFIFNCLNSIQHFMLKGDIKQTNKYISEFGNIIRQTMDNSATANISLTNEINYLTSYLELEQMRFSSSFHYEISLDKRIEPDYTYIPSMLLQPFVENAIRHGIRYKQNGTGAVQIRIEQEEEHMVITIEDNGIGREAAARYKSEQHIEYQSKGITLTQKRIDILNAANTEKIDRRIIDLKNENGKPAGTKVVLSFPLPVIEKFN